VVFRKDRSVASADDMRTAPIASFGPFRLHAAERRLERNDEAVAIGSRSLDILIALVARAGEILSQRELIARVWPDVVVEESNLRVHVTRLRKALGDGNDGARYIANVPGRGYCFVASIQWVGARPRTLPVTDDAFGPETQGLPSGLPSRPTRMVGRAETVGELSALLRSHRFVSVVGAGVVGKTTVAVATAHALLDDFESAVFFVDVGTLADAALLPFSIALVLGFHAQALDPMAALVAFLSGRRLLLVLDCCEHVIAAAATAAERLFSEAPQIHLLVTSREALRAEGEHVLLLRPLETPPSGAELTAVEALASPAVQLFMERAAVSGHRLPLSDGDASIVADMCRRLDGIALAIELAASRVGMYGIRGTAGLLDGGVRLAWHGRRSAIPRHQTLQAMLDWSYHLLSERDRRVLYRLSIFVGLFTVEGSQAVVEDAEMDGLEVTSALTNLVDKSLVSTPADAAPILFRLLDTTRAYAAAKLATSGERDEIAGKHACYYSEKLKAQAIDPITFRGLNFTIYAPHVGNARAALAWSFSDRGDRVMAVQLAARSAPLFLGLGLFAECRDWCERGLAAMDDSQRDTGIELALCEGFATTAVITQGNGDEVRTAIERGLELAERLGERRHILYLLGGLNLFLLWRGDFGGALEGAKRYRDAAKSIGSDHDIAMADWMLGNVYQFLGDQKEAQQHLELGFDRASIAAPVEVDFFTQHRVRARSTLARVLWLRGFPDRAVSTFHQAIEEAERYEHAPTSPYCFMSAYAVSLWRGDLDEAAEHIEHIRTVQSGVNRARHEVLVLARAELEITRGESTVAVGALRVALATLQAQQQLALWTMYSRVLAEGLAQTGENVEAIATIDAALARAEQTGGAYDVPELLRVKGQILLSSSNSSTKAAEQVLLQSLAAARKQSALSRELRSAIALARLWAGQGRVEAARQLLLGVYRQFTEGFSTADLKMAVQLLEQLGAAGVVS
jgi:predicted ATPase/DNA-binding winged helix-turn-helix (wHTH) protein